MKEKEPNKLQSTFVPIYQSTLDFIAKAALPVAIVLVGLIYKPAIEDKLRNVSKLETPWLTAEFLDSIVEDTVTVATSNDPEVKNRAIQRIEMKTEFLDAQRQAQGIIAKPEEGIRSDSPSDDPKDSEEGWETVVSKSWVKPSDLFGRSYFLTIDDGLYFWPTRFDSSKNEVEFIINTSKKGPESGIERVSPTWLAIGSDYNFTVKGESYRVTLEDIKPAGKIPTNAAFISVSRKK